jgi:hypothetical protein
VAVVDIEKFEVRDRYPLLEGVMFRSLAVGRKTGRLYLFGNRPVVKELGPSGSPRGTALTYAPWPG